MTGEGTTGGPRAEQSGDSALRERMERLERDLSDRTARANAAVAEAQDRSYWLDRWRLDLNELMRRRGPPSCGPRSGPCAACTASSTTPAAASTGCRTGSGSGAPSSSASASAMRPESRSASRARSPCHCCAPHRSPTRCSRDSTRPTWRDRGAARAGRGGDPGCGRRGRPAAVDACVRRPPRRAAGARAHAGRHAPARRPLDGARPHRGRRLHLLRGSGGGRARALRRGARRRRDVARLRLLVRPPGARARRGAAGRGLARLRSAARSDRVGARALPGDSLRARPRVPAAAIRRRRRLPRRGRDLHLEPLLRKREPALARGDAPDRDARRSPAADRARHGTIAHTHRLGLRSADQLHEVRGALDEHGFWWAPEFGEAGDHGLANPDWGTAFLAPEWLLARATPIGVVLLAPGGVEDDQDLYVLERRR